MLQLESLLEQAGGIPALPEIYLRVNELLESPDSSAEQIGVVVQTDPSLTVRVLKMINSAYYGLPNAVTSIPQAVSLLGRAPLGQLLVRGVLCSVVSEMRTDDFPIHDFWRHSIKTAIIGRQLAMQSTHIIDHEAFFTAGLLHDIGWLMIARVVPGAYQDITALAKSSNRDVIEVETEKLGVTHVEVAVALMNHWQIPGLITRCIHWHHHPEHDGHSGNETCIIGLANHLSRYQESENEGELDLVLSEIPYWGKSGCGVNEIRTACKLAEEQWIGVMESLGMTDLDLGQDDEDPFEFNTRIV